jgi:hypothetical protein
MGRKQDRECRPADLPASSSGVVDVQFPNQKEANNIFTEFPNLHSDPAVNGSGTPVSMITSGISSFSFTNSLGMSSALNMSNRAKAQEQRARRLNDG